MIGLSKKELGIYLQEEFGIIFEYGENLRDQLKILARRIDKSIVFAFSVRANTNNNDNSGLLRKRTLFV